MIKMYLGDDDDVNAARKNTPVTALEQQQQEEEVVEEDRPYSRDEIHVMLRSANDIRAKIIILLISSSGMRIGAIPLLKLRILVKVEKLGLYQISVYEGLYSYSGVGVRVLSFYLSTNKIIIYYIKIELNYKYIIL
jgi:hypothetical protein